MISLLPKHSRRQPINPTSSVSPARRVQLVGDPSWHSILPLPVASLLPNRPGLSLFPHHSIPTQYPSYLPPSILSCISLCPFVRVCPLCPSVCLCPPLVSLRVFVSLGWTPPFVSILGCSSGCSSNVGSSVFHCALGRFRTDSHLASCVESRSVYSTQF